MNVASRAVARLRSRSERRRGVAAVETAIVLPFLLMIIMFIWDMGRYIWVSRVAENSVRAGARAAAAVRIDDVGVTQADVEDRVLDALALAMPDRPNIRNEATVTFTPMGSVSWTDPADANQLDVFEVRLDIPQSSFEWISPIGFVTPAGPVSAKTVWASMKDVPVSINTTIPQ